MHPFRAASSVGAVLTALPLALGALVAPTVAPPAAAAPGQVALASPQPLPTAQMDGIVLDQAVVGNTVYVVGEFKNARPAGAAAGENESPRYNAMAFDITTGALLDWAPKVNGKINAVEASADGSTIYLGGNFTSVNDETVYRVAAVDAAGKRKPLGASANGAVMDLELSPDGSTLYLGGSFTQINSSARQRAGAVDLKTNKVNSFAPQVDNSLVRSITVAADNSAVAIGGSFTSVDGSSDAYGIAVLEKSGSLRHTNISSVIRNAGSNSGIMSLKSDSRGLYGTAYSQEGAFEGMFRASWTTGDIDLMADCHGDTYDVLPTTDVIYIASHTHDCSNIGGFSDGEESGKYHHAVGFSSTATGTVQRNKVWGYTDFEGQPAPTQYNGFLPGFQIGEYSGLSQAVWTVEGNSQYIVYGGEFVAVNGTKQQGLVRFAASGGDANAAAPGDEGGNDNGDNGKDNGDNGKDNGDNGKDNGDNGKDKKNKDKKDKKKNKKKQDDWDNQDGWGQDGWDNQDGWGQDGWGRGGWDNQDDEW
ncbi:hypothetical protein [Actinomyces oris]|uniref:hypothetical protein n=1 Tax=Actinomyces oris TaxID=544580 RepID=UPI0028E96F4A|nr:hypothetical protein [Actinomyces oris]